MTIFLPLDPILRAMLPSAPQCPEPAAVQAAVQTATEFCRQSGIWRETFQLAVSPSDDTIIPLPANTLIHEIESVRWTGAGYNGCPLTPISLRDLEHHHSGWRDWSPGVPEWITQTTWNTVRLVPGAYGDTEIAVTCMPHPEAEELPDYLVLQFRDMLAAGALAKVLMTRDTPYHDPRVAAVHEARYREMADDAYAASIRGQQRGPVRTRGHYM